MERLRPHADAIIRDFDKRLIAGEICFYRDFWEVNGIIEHIDDHPVHFFRVMRDHRQGSGQVLGDGQSLGFLEP